MGEIADMMIEGMLCQQCGAYLGEGDGFPVTCEDCAGEDSHHQDDRVGCPHCGKRVKQIGLQDHIRAKHS